ncbi:FAS1-like dehydratase domain-containing protein [Pseudonocardia kunmingensis]|uniref:Acyl dehydratase n=1 Tax=Pseudonocardia kunmingensis TaxID=630975 RepID=A0A543DPR6_9PSEU|nr:MaoC family dehydratase N-terminal domain-containing protein [Pseudonocardia kunmingensis]TQM11332.1 acyl dehydratase [Pseudonocardia kunmingensis]
MSETRTDAQQQEEFAKQTSAELQDADIDKDRAILGRDWASREQEYLSTATPEAIRNFAHSYGDDNPLFTDPDYGRGTRWGGQIAPPIMAGILNSPLRGEKPSREERGGSYRGIHAFVSGGTWDWYRPIRPGDTVYSFGGLESVDVKRSEFAGRSVVKVRRQVKMNGNAEVIGVYRTLVIYTERKRARERGKYSGLEAPSYTDEDIAKLEELYAAEQRRGAATRHVEDVAVGEELAPMVKGPLTTTDMIVFHAGGYGFVPYGLRTGRMAHQNRQRIAPFFVKNSYGVPDVAQRVHWDSAWAQAIGNPRAYDYGVLRECWAHHFLTDWAGDDGWVVSQHDEIRKFNYQGDVQYFGGEVTAKHERAGQWFVDVAFRGTNQRGEETIRGTAILALPSREHGPALLPDVPVELQRKAIEMLSTHGELLADTR